MRDRGHSLKKGRKHGEQGWPESSSQDIPRGLHEVQGPVGCSRCSGRPITAPTNWTLPLIFRQIASVFRYETRCPPIPVALLASHSREPHRHSLAARLPQSRCRGMFVAFQSRTWRMPRPCVRPDPMLTSQVGTGRSLFRFRPQWLPQN